MAKSYKWVVEFTVHGDSWIEDGFDITKTKAEMMIQQALPFSLSTETSVKVLKAPDKRIIRKLQGYGGD